jgi:hypothetical protein
MKYLLLLLIIALQACNNNTDTVSLNDKEKTGYNNAKENLADLEKRKPLQFLKIDGKYKRNKLFGISVFKGSISNKATVVAYGKIRVKLLYYNEAGTLVENHEEEIEETIEPGDNVKFTARYKTPKGTDSIKASIMSAVPK